MRRSSIAARHGTKAGCVRTTKPATRATYGQTVRVKQTIYLRRFPPIPRATKKFERKYKGRTSVGRANVR